MIFDTDDYKSSFFKYLKKLQNNYTGKVLMKKAMTEYDRRVVLSESDRFELEVKNFARILSSSSPVNEINSVGLYALVYAQPNEVFTFVDTFPVIYIFNELDLENKTIAGINLNRLPKKDALKYIKGQVQSKDIKQRRNLEYSYLNKYGKANSPFRRFKARGVVQAWKLNLNSLQYFDLSFMSKHL